MNPKPETLSTSLIERLAQCIPGDEDNAALCMVLDPEGYDTTDRDWVRQVRKRAAHKIHARRAQFGALALLIDMRLPNEEIGRWLDNMPKSTVQAMACGRVVERLTPAQKAGFSELLALLQVQLDSVVAALG